MHNEHPQRSATIIAFPQRASSARGTPAGQSISKSPAVPSEPAQRVVTGAWYHDDAINEAAPVRKQ
jgi:hypothetical protein